MAENLETQVENQTETNIETTQVNQSEPEIIDTRAAVEKAFEKHEKAEEAKVAEEKARDEKGRFAGKPTIEEKKPEENPDSTPEQKTEEQTKEADSAQQEQKSVPYRWNAWKKDVRPILEALPEETQKIIQERESYFHKGLQSLKAEAERAKSYDSMYSAHDDYFKQIGMQPHQVVPLLIEAEKTLRFGNPEQKVQAIRGLIHDYGIDMGSLSEYNFDPNIHALRQQVQQLQAMQQGFTRPQQAIEAPQVESDIQSFAENNEHFEELRESMADLLDRGFANNLQDAYDKALRLNGDLFAKHLESQKAAEARAKMMQEDKAAKAAKAAATSVKGSPSSVTNAQSFKNTEDAVRAAFAKHGL